MNTNTKLILNEIDRLRAQGNRYWDKKAYYFFDQDLRFFEGCNPILSFAWQLEREGEKFYSLNLNPTEAIDWLQISRELLEEVKNHALQYACKEVDEKLYELGSILDGFGYYKDLSRKGKPGPDVNIDALLERLGDATFQCRLARIELGKLWGAEHIILHLERKENELIQTHGDDEPF